MDTGGGKRGIPNGIENLYSGLLVGQREIMDFFKIKTRKTLKKWRKKWSMPVHHLPDGRPFCVVYEVIQWAVSLSELSAGRRLHDEN